jgi:hypothetical protein
MEHNIAGAACPEQGRVWEIDPETGIPDTENPMIVGDDVAGRTETEYCSAHMGMTITGIERGILVNAWYTGGVDVIDFTRVRRPVHGSAVPGAQACACLCL